MPRGDLRTPARPHPGTPKIVTHRHADFEKSLARKGARSTKGRTPPHVGSVGEAMVRVPSTSVRATAGGSVWSTWAGLTGSDVDASSTGKPRRKRSAIRELRKAADQGQDLAAKPRTVTEWMNYWMTEIKTHDGTRPSTLARYRHAIDGHIVPLLGKIRLDKLGPADIRRLHAARRDQMKPASLVKIHAVLRAALADAERMDLVSRNVAKAVRPPSLAGEESHTLTINDARRFLALAGDDRLEALFVLALMMGLRRGELLGLSWDDIDLDARTLRIRRSVQRVGGQLRLVEPKTHGSRRTAPIPAFAVDAPERQRKRQADERNKAGDSWQDNGLVFASTVGTPMEPRNVTRRVQQLRGGAGLPWLRLHDFRH